nr:hypothetical protein CFP56_50722 [Quercus suber]
MQMAAEVGNENPRVVDEVEAENSGPFTDSMQTDAVLGANRADVEELNSGENEVQVVSRLEELLEHVPYNNQPSLDGARLSNFKPKSTWTRFNRMEFGLGGLACAITLLTLGKRDMRDDVGE